MISPIQALIDLAAARHNCGVLREAAGKRGLFVVVKADAYGHGMLPFAKAVEEDVDGLCVFDVRDAVSLREAGLRLPIMVMGGFRTPDELALLAGHSLWAVVHQAEQVSLLESSSHKPARVFVKAQTGMHRLGILPADVPALVDRLRSCGCADLALMHHFANADLEGGTTDQERIMRDLVAACGLPYTASNSAATLLAADSGEEFVRCGIAAYGCSPATSQGVTAKSLNLKPVMTLASEVISVQDVASGAAVGYGSRWRVTHADKIAVVACGYADGYPRAMPDGTLVSVAGQSFPLAGRVSMEMLTVCTGQSQVSPGDKVELWGANVAADYVAAQVDTIAYELLAGLPAKVPRTVVA